MTDAPAPLGASSLLPAGDIQTTTLLDGTTIALPAARGDMSPISVLRSDAMAEISRLKADAPFRQLLLQGDANALARVQQLERITKTPTGTFYGNEQTPAQVDQHQQAWRDFSDIGTMFGAGVEQALREGKPIFESEYRRSKETLAALKSNKDWVKRYFDGDRRCRGEMQYLNRLITSPVIPDPR